MDLNDLTIGQARELARMFATQAADETHPLLDKPVFIRTVTHHYTGLLVEVRPQEYVLEEAAWIADDGRFHLALREGALGEVEPFPDVRVYVGRGGILDMSEWLHDLPREVK